MPKQQHISYDRPPGLPLKDWYAMTSRERRALAMRFNSGEQVLRPEPDAYLPHRDGKAAVLPGEKPLLVGEKRALKLAEGIENGPSDS